MANRDHLNHDSAGLIITIITVSSTREHSTDISGETAERQFSTISTSLSRRIIKDSEASIKKMIDEESGSNVLVFLGGTGPSRLDVTTRTLRKYCQKEIPGFGEIFRRRSEDSAGVMAYLSDASMFIDNGRVIFSLPGSVNAQQTAFPIIREMVFHALHEANKE